MFDDPLLSVKYLLNRKQTKKITKTLTASQNINASKETIIHPKLLIYYAYAVMKNA